MDSSTTSIGIIGLGLMGTPMTTRLLNAGFTVNIWNRSPDKTPTLVEHGAIACRDIQKLVECSTVVLLSLTDTKAVEDVVFGPNGIASVAATDKVLVDTSSIEPAATVEFAKALEEANQMTWVDAPVSGGVSGAEMGTLSFMLGGAVDTIEQVLPILKHLGQRFTHMGPNGAGQTTKVFNQMIVGCNAVAVAEVMALAKKSNVDAGKIAEAFSGGFADSKPLQLMAPRMAANDFEPVQWHVATLIKDLKNAEKLSKEYGQELAACKEALRCMSMRGPDGLETDLSTLVKVFE